MKRIIFTLLAAFIMLAAFNGCSKKASEQIIGKWKVKTETTDPQMQNIEAIYEFTKTNMNIEIKGLELPHNKIETTYTVKADDGNTVTLEVIHPVTKVKGEFKITITDNKMKMIDPDGQSIDLTKI
jgi:ABC-type glycerol-3-phosphate transport system substrate-binding protein